jgi:hypothetical protein
LTVKQKREVRKFGKTETEEVSVSKKLIHERRPTMFKKTNIIITIVCLSLLTGMSVLYAAEDLQNQIDEIKSALPKFAIPMREVGDRFQNIYFAAQGGNWGLVFTCPNT